MRGPSVAVERRSNGEAAEPLDDFRLFCKRQRARLAERFRRSAERIRQANEDVAEAEWELRQVVRGGGKKPSLDFYDRRGW